MANTISSDELGQDQTTNQAGQGNSNTNQAGQAPVQNNSQAPTITSSQTSNANPSNPNKQQGSGYTNIQKVIGANQGNQLGSAVGNNIQQVGNSAQQNLSQAQNQFNQQSQANQFNTSGNNQLVQNAFANPTDVTSNPNQASQFQTLLSGQYQGPQGLQNAGQIQAQAGNVAQMGQALGSSGGRLGLLQQLVGGNNYQSGAQNLDNLLLGQSNDPSLQAAKRQALTLQGQVGNAVQGAQAQAQQYGNQAQQYGKALQNQFGQTVTGANSALQNQATDLQNQRNTQYQKTLADLKSGNISQDEANLLGLTQGESVYNTLNDPSKFINENPQQANAQNVASAQDYAKMQALQQLAGNYAPQQAGQILSQYSNPAQAQSFQNAQGVQGNQQNFQSTLNNAQSNYNSLLKPVQTAQDVVRLSSGQVTPQEIQSFISQNPQYANNPAASASNPSFRALVGESLAAKEMPSIAQGSALSGSGTYINPQQAANYLAQQQTAEQQALASLGPLKTINIQPSAYPTIAQGSQNLEQGNQFNVS